MKYLKRNILKIISPEHKNELNGPNKKNIRIEKDKITDDLFLF